MSHSRVNTKAYQLMPKNCDGKRKNEIGWGMKELVICRTYTLSTFASLIDT
jgi:hypothetical protein